MIEIASTIIGFVIMTTKILIMILKTTMVELGDEEHHTKCCEDWMTVDLDTCCSIKAGDA